MLLTGASLGLYGPAEAAEGQALNSSNSSVTVAGTSAEVSTEQTSVTVTGGGSAGTDETAAGSSQAIVTLSGPSDTAAPAADTQVIGATADDQSQNGQEGQLYLGSQTASDSHQAAPASSAARPAAAASTGQAEVRVEGGGRPADDRLVGLSQAIKKAQADQAPRPVPVLHSGTKVPVAPVDPTEPASPADVPAGALLALNQALAAIVVPAFGQLALFQALPLNVPRAAAALAAAVLVLSGLAGISLFVQRLRRCGFCRAPRSDMAAGLFTFATPEKVSFAWALSPAASSSFFGVRNTNSFNQRF